MNLLPKWSLKTVIYIVTVMGVCLTTAKTQNIHHQDTFNKKRFIAVAAVGTVVYSATVVGLYHTWYKDFDHSTFHFFNDWNEWQNMDKAGHAFTSYFETELCYLGTRWAGLPEKPAVWTATALSLVFQTTIELFDAHSDKWGFSWYDMAFNVAGTTLFTAQQLIWQEQRIRMKVSSWPRKYPSNTLYSVDGQGESSLAKRAGVLFGTGFAERYLKDYNAQTIWLSVNPSSFMSRSTFPKWLNVAAGYSAENLYGGYGNTWLENEHRFAANSSEYPRLKQWFLSADIDFSRIRTESKFLKTVFTILNIFKVPSPTLEINSMGKVKWHWMFL